MHRFDIRKAAQVSAFLTNKEGGKINILKLTKLLYLAERLCIEKHSFAMIDDEYFSRDTGPILSNTLDFLNGKKQSSEWKEFISAKEGNFVSTSPHVDFSDIDMAYDELSDSDIEILDDIYSLHGNKSSWELVLLTHDKAIVPEWKDPKGKRLPITLDDILAAVGRSEAQIAEIKAEAEALKFFEATYEAARNRHSFSQGFNEIKPLS